MLVSDHARGIALDVQVTASTVETDKYGPVPVLDVRPPMMPQAGSGAVFIVNRSQTDTVATELVWQAGGP